MRTILVVVFITLSVSGERVNHTTWRKDMKTEALCWDKVKQLKEKNSQINAYCTTPFGKGKQG
jgi:hypothetical protein